MDFHGKKIYFFTVIFLQLGLFSRLTSKWMRGCAEIGFILPNMRQSSGDYTSNNLKCGKEGVSWLIYIFLAHPSVQFATTARHTTAHRTARLTTTHRTANTEFALDILLAVMEELLTSLLTDLLEQIQCGTLDL
jgi:hypothetical protein